MVFLHARHLEYPKNSYTIIVTIIDNYNMLSRSLRNSGRLSSKRFQHSSSGSTSTASNFTNKHNFNINPPPVHEYWNYRNASVILAVIPLYAVAAYTAKSLGADFEGFSGLLSFKKNEQSPLNELSFAEPQTFAK